MAVDQLIFLSLQCLMIQPVYLDATQRLTCPLDKLSHLSGLGVKENEVTPSILLKEVIAWLLLLTEFQLPLNIEKENSIHLMNEYCLSLK